jgi:hypothetical protein
MTGLKAKLTELNVASAAWKSPKRTFKDEWPQPA